jgi:hypothetical protein
MKLKVTLVFLALSLAATAQMVGLPEYGITLSGSMEDPVLTNHSGKTIVATQLIVESADGHRIALQGTHPEPIADGGISSIGPGPTGFHRTGFNFYPSVEKLTAVIFSDGEARGHLDTEEGKGYMAYMQKHFQEYAKSAKLAEQGKWGELSKRAEFVDPNEHDGFSSASELLAAKDTPTLAKKIRQFSQYPTSVWRKK